MSNIFYESTILNSFHPSVTFIYEATGGYNAYTKTAFLNSRLFINGTTIYRDRFYKIAWIIYENCRNALFLRPATSPIGNPCR
jgi:hypothetical protein